MAQNASFSWSLYRHVLLVAQSPGLPTAADWAEYAGDIEPLEFKGVLVVGEGNKLDATQRAQVERLLKLKGARNAVVSSSAITRGVMIALSWMGVPVKGFAPGHVGEALAYLDVAPEHQGEALSILEDHQRALRERFAPIRKAR